MTASSLVDSVFEINNTQISVNDTFSDGSCLHHLAASIQDGYHPPSIRVAKMDGSYWSIDNRRLFLYKALELHTEEFDVELVDWTREFSMKRRMEDNQFYSGLGPEVIRRCCCEDDDGWGAWVNLYEENGDTFTEQYDTFASDNSDDSECCHCSNDAASDCDHGCCGNCCRQTNDSCSRHGEENVDTFMEQYDTFASDNSDDTFASDNSNDTFASDNSECCHCSNDAASDCDHGCCGNCCRQTNDSCSHHGEENGDTFMEQYDTFASDNSDDTFASDNSGGTFASDNSECCHCSNDAASDCDHGCCGNCCRENNDACSRHGEWIPECGHCSNKPASDCDHGCCGHCCLEYNNYCSRHGSMDIPDMIPDIMPECDHCHNVAAGGCDHGCCGACCLDYNDSCGRHGW